MTKNPIENMLETAQKVELTRGRGLRLECFSRTGSHLLGMSLSTSQCYLDPCHPVLLGSLALGTSWYFLGCLAAGMTGAHGVAGFS